MNSSILNKWIGPRGQIEWPARSPDLTPCDFWLWAELRTRLYYPGRREFGNLNELENTIRTLMNEIPLDHFRKSMRDFLECCDTCIRENGGLFEQ